MYVYDFNGDGLPDVISSSAHNFGVWWYEQKKGASGPEFVQHEIDRSFSQSHALVMADIKGDGQPDFVTGKRWWAHGPKGDVNPNDPAVLYWFEFKRQAGQVALPLLRITCQVRTSVLITAAGKRHAGHGSSAGRPPR